MRKPLTGQLAIRVLAVKDVDHAPLARFARAPEGALRRQLSASPQYRKEPAMELGLARRLADDIRDLWAAAPAAGARTAATPDFGHRAGA